MWFMTLRCVALSWATLGQQQYGLKLSYSWAYGADAISHF